MHSYINVEQVATYFAHERVKNEVSLNEAELYFMIGDEKRYTPKAQEVFDRWYEWYANWLSLSNNHKIG